MSQNTKNYQGLRGKRILGLLDKNVIAASFQQKQTEPVNMKPSTLHANTHTTRQKGQLSEAVKRKLFINDDTGPVYPKLKMSQNTKNYQGLRGKRILGLLDKNVIAASFQQKQTEPVNMKPSTLHANTHTTRQKGQLSEAVKRKLFINDDTGPVYPKRQQTDSVPGINAQATRIRNKQEGSDEVKRLTDTDFQENIQFHFADQNIGCDIEKYRERECLPLSNHTQDKHSINKQKSLSMSDLTYDNLDRVTSTRRWQSLSFIAENNAYDCDSILLELYKPFSKPNESNSSLEIDNVCHENIDCLDDDNNSNRDRDRKRQKNADENSWKKNKAKRQRMLGEEYLGYSKPANSKIEQNILRPAREMGERCNSDFCKRSKFRGCDRVTEDTRLEIHQYFWKNLNWDQRKVYVANCVKRTNTGRKTKSSADSRRDQTLCYFLPLSRDGNERIQVCREMFLRTLSLGSFTVQSWTKQAAFGMVCNKEKAMDLRNRGYRVDVNRKVLMSNNFLDNIPKLPSHYARKETTKLFIEPSYKNLRQLFNDYKAYCKDNEEPQVSRYTFEKMFHEKNLSLYTLKKDMCDTCSAHKVGNINDVDYQAHIAKKNRARQEKDNDKKAAESKEFIVLTVDLEAVKVCPYLTASKLYFKTKLTCHNYTVYDLTTRDCCCYWFDETAADLTANTFTSLLIDYLERKCIPRNLPIIVFSDGCTYQNRNSILSNALLNLSMRHGITITQKYLEPGHTQMECDSVHAAIERKLNNREIHLPSDYVSITKEARQTKPYDTVLVEYDFCKDFSSDKNLYYKSIRPGKKAGEPQVVDIRAILYEPNGQIKVKLDFDDEWTALPQRPRRISPTYEQCRFEKIPIKLTKFNHLQELKAVMPKDCHSYYDNLAHE